MDAFVNELIPNVIKKWPDLWVSFGETMYMMAVSGAISFVFGLILGVILTVTAPGRILQNKVVYNILDKVINIFRSIPFIILLAMLVPVTRIVMSSGIGTRSLIFPLFISAFPYMTRMVESSLNEVDRGVIEAAQSMGSTTWQII